MLMSPWLNEEASSHHPLIIQCKVQIFCIKPIIYVWSVTGTPKWSCACEISFNHTYLHRNGYWLSELPTQPCHWCATEYFSFTPCSVLSGKTTINKMTTWFWKENCTTKHTSRTGYAKVSVSKPDTLQYQTVSYEAQEMRSPVVHAPKLCAQDLKWAEWKVACSGTQQRGAEFATRHHFKSVCLVCLTSNINITKIYSSSRSAVKEPTAQGCCCQTSKDTRRTDAWK